MRGESQPQHAETVDAVAHRDPHVPVAVGSGGRAALVGASGKGAVDVERLDVLAPAERHRDEQPLGDAGQVELGVARAEPGRGRGHQPRDVLGRQLVAGIEDVAENLLPVSGVLVISVLVATAHRECLPQIPRLVSAHTTCAGLGR